MDMTPPQAPPAIVSSESQASIDIVTRLDATQAWLIEQQDAYPALPDAPTPEGKDVFLAAVRAFWQAPLVDAPGAPSTTRATAFAKRMATALRDTATLRRDDGTLEPAVADLAIAASRAEQNPLPAGVRLSALIIGTSAYAGAVVVEDDSRTDLALAFTPDRGWEHFKSIDSLRQVMEHRLRETLAVESSLPGVSDVATDAFNDATGLTTRPLGDQPFQRMAERIVEVQLDKTRHAWDRLAGGESDLADFVDRATIASRLSSHLDIHAILAHRDASLAEALDEQRLRNVPGEVRSDWYRARADYRNTMQSMAEIRRDEGITDTLSLDDFVRAQLAARLVEAGATENPAMLVAHLTEIPMGDPIASLSLLFGGIQEQKVPLVALALRNVASHGLTVTGISRSDGQPLSVALSGATLSQWVRDLDAGRRYAEYVESRLRSTPGGALARDIAVNLHRARMRFEAADARLSYYLADEPRSFYDDRDEYGYRMLAAVLDAPVPGGRAKVLNHDIVVSQLTLKGIPLSDMIVVSPRDTRASARVVFYTPGAPDGREYREFATRADAAREFLLKPAFEQYLLDRLPAEFARTEANGTRRFRMSHGAHLAQWVLSQGSNPGQVRTDSPFEERAVEGDFLQAMYDASIDRVLHDVRGATRTTDQADSEANHAVLDSLASALNWQGRAAAHVATEAVLSVPRTFQASWRFYDNVKAGDYTQAYLDAVDGYTSALNVIGLRPLLPRAVGALVRTRPGAATLSPTRRIVADAEGVFESRFVTHVELAGATRSSEGFHVIGGRHYLRQNDKTYGVRYDRGHSTWRLTRDGALDANFTGPAIARTPEGLWTYRHDLGLLGGSPHDVTPGMHVLLRSRGVADPEFGALSLAQRDIFLRQLSRLTGGADEATQALLDARATGVPTAVHVPAWREALRLARHMPGAPINRSLYIAPEIVHNLATPPAPMNMVYVPPSEWPDAVWYYMPRADAPMFRGAAASVRQHRLSTHIGVPVYSHSPYAPFPGMPGNTYGSLKGAWLRINMRALASRHTGSLLPPVDVFRYGIGDPGTFTIRPRPSTSTRGMAPSNVWLWGAEFEVGTWPRLTP